MAARGWEGDDEDAAFAARRGGATDPAPGSSQAEGGGEATTSDTPQKAPPPTKRKRNLLSESHLLSQDGFKKIYQTFPYQTSGSVAGQEAKALASLIKMYKQWAFDLYPGLHFEDFVDRTESLGKSHAVQGLLSDLRSKEMRRVLGLPEDETRELLEETGRNQGDDSAPNDNEPDPDESGFLVPGGDDDDDDPDGNYSDQEVMF